MSGAAQARRVVRWTLQHGLARAALIRAAHGGDLQAQLIMATRRHAEPYPVHEKIRARGSLVRGRLSYVSATHAVCRDVLRSDDFRVGPPPTPVDGLVNRVFEWSGGEKTLHPVEPPSLLAVEAPEHTRYRKLVSKVFTARAVEGLRSSVQATADELLDAMATRPGTDVLDLVDDYATALPLAVISDILGVDRADRARVRELGGGVAASLDAGLSWREFRHVDSSLRAFDAWLGGHLERLRHAPGVDLLSQLVTVRDDGGGLTETELRATAGLLLAAGFETTVNLLGSATELLVRHPEQRERLTSGEVAWAGAVEESLRFESPVQVTARVALRDTVVQGVPVRAGRMVATVLAGANRDPQVFDEPNTFDVGRVNARDHLAFSAGRHFCLGAALARIEGEVGLASLFARFPDLQLATGARRRPTRVLRGWQHLPVRTGRAVTPA